jgi:hypothetical protein
MQSEVVVREAAAATLSNRTRGGDILWEARCVRHLFDLGLWDRGCDRRVRR